MQTAVSHTCKPKVKSRMQDIRARMDSLRTELLDEARDKAGAKLAARPVSIDQNTAAVEPAMTVDISDAQLVERVQRGDRTAFDLLVIKYQHKVFKLVSRLISNPAEAEDVAQEAFIKAYRALKSFRGDSAFYTWLYRIAINTAKNALVSNSRRPVDFNLDMQDPDQYELQARLKEGDTPEGMLLTEEIRLTVQAAMQELPDDLRTAITLRELEGLSYEEIAAAMECPVGTVRSRIFRAREAIDKKLAPLLD